MVIYSNNHFDVLIFIILRMEKNEDEFVMVNVDDHISKRDIQSFPDYIFFLSSWVSKLFGDSLVTPLEVVYFLFFLLFSFFFPF